MRYTVSYLCAAASIALAPSVTLAQTTPTDPSVESYLCAFAGKCGDTAPVEAVTMDAPATKGFRISRANVAQVPTPVASPSATRDAPQAKGFRVAKIAPEPQRQPRREVRPQPPRTSYARPRAQAAAPSGVGRANLMIGFELGSDRMTDSGRKKAAIFARSLNMVELRGLRFAIEGHTDSLGDPEANRDLSQRRAQTVAQYLADNGVDRTRLEVKGVGADAPLPGYSASNPANRRVEAEVIR